MSVLGETRRQIVAPVGELVAAFCLVLADMAGKGAQAAGAVGRAIERRQVLCDLAALDDHMLKDIGVTRSDLRDAAATPLMGDPTRVLILRATERRAAIRLSARVRSGG